MSEDKVLFYEPYDENGYLCNLSPYKVVYDGLVWPTSEHCYQAQKHRDFDYKERIRMAETPEEAIILGRDETSKSYRHDDWYSVRVEIMHDIVLAKFQQNEDIRRELLATGNKQIAEHTSNDSFWGDALDGSGQNWLGRILMQVREELRK